MADSPLVHAVFFSLKDRTPPAVESLTAACRSYLADHPGIVSFFAGPRASEYQRAVNDQDFDVALVVAFASAHDHDRYQESPRHKLFIAEQAGNWARVRVFDSRS